MVTPAPALKEVSVRDEVKTSLMGSPFSSQKEFLRFIFSYFLECTIIDRIAGIFLPSSSGTGRARYRFLSFYRFLVHKRSLCLPVLNKKPIGCKYTRNRSTSQNLFFKGEFEGYRAEHTGMYADRCCYCRSSIQKNL